MQSYDVNKPSKFIMYLNANSVYGWVMSQYLPCNGFKWLNQKEIGKFDVHFVEENSSDKYILEVDLECPDELHGFPNDYPLAPKNLEISNNVLSNYCCCIANKYGIKIGVVNKLVPNLANKSEYILHYKNLKLYLSLGMKLVSVHRVLNFKQLIKDWLKKYIDFNADKRKNAANIFENDFFKVMNNSTFGKTKENLRKRIKLGKSIMLVIIKKM